MADRARALAALSGLAMLAACHAPRQAGNEGAPAPIPSSVATPQPSPSATPVAALRNYAGHYPFDAVDGVRFLDQPAVVSAVNARVPDKAIRALVLGGDGPGTPIALQDGKLVAWGCETHNCGDHDWSVAIAPDGGDAAICYHDAATMRARSRWYLAPGRSEMRDGDCPSG